MRGATLVTSLVTAALLGTAILLLPRFAIEPDLAKMLPAGHPHVQLASLLDQRADSRRALFVVVRGAIDDARLGTLAESLRASPHVAEVAATTRDLLGARFATGFAAPLWHLPPDRLTALAARLAPDGRRAALRDTLQVLAEDPLGGRQLAVQDPLGLRWLLADAAVPDLPVPLRRDTPFAIFADGRGAVLRIVGRDSAMNPAFARTILADLEARLDAGGWRYDLFGGYVIARADADRIRHDLQASILWSSVLVSLYLLFSMRSPARALLAMVPVALAAFTALSLGSALFGPLTPVAIAAAAVLVGLGVDFSIHYLVRYDAERRGTDHGQAAGHTHRAIGAPLAIGMTTTVIAFLSLALGDFGGLAGFGMLLALGLVLAFLGTRFLLPVLLIPVRSAPAHRDRNLLAATAERIADSRHGRRLAGALLGLAAVAAGIVASRGIELRADPQTLRPADDAVDASRARLEQELGMTLLPCFLLLDAKVTPDRAAPAVAELRARKLLVATAGLSPRTVARQARVAAFRAATADWLPGTLRDMADLGFDPAPFRPGLEALQARLLADPPAAEAATVRIGGRLWQPLLCYPAPDAMQRTGWQALQAGVRATLGSDAALYGTPTLQAELEQVLRHDLLTATVVTVVLAFGLVLVTSRSPRAGLFALLPTLCGLSITLAVLALGEVPITLGNFVAIPFLLGIGVDDGVHLVAHLRRTAKAGVTGVAVVRTSITTILAFGSLVTAASPGLASLGWIIALGVTCCLLTSLLILPPLWSNREP